MKPIEFRAAAQNDVDEAFEWYESQRNGLGEEFREKLREAIQRIESNPNQYQVVYRDLRRALLERFPYGLFYREMPTAIVVVACFHTSRNPGRWARRR